MKNMKKMAVVIAGIGLALTACSGDDSTAEETTANGEITQSSAVEQIAPAKVSNEYITITEHGFILGDAESADPITVYQDYNCPHCKNLHGEMVSGDKVSTWINEGASVEYVPVNYLGARTTHDFSTRAANVLTLVADKYPEKFKEVQEGLFEHQPTSTTQEVSDDDLISVLEEAGIEPTEEDRNNIAGVAYRDWIESATDYAAEQGVNYIPQVWYEGANLELETYTDIFNTIEDGLNK